MKNMKNKLFVTLGILGMSLLSYAGTKHSLETSYPSYKGLIMAGVSRLVSWTARWNRPRIWSLRNWKTI